jgi:mono/diheme cytochrome c family protein
MPEAMRRLAAAAVLLPLALAGCRQGMFDDAKYEPYEASPLFPDGSSARPLPAGTVARGQLGEDRALATGVGEDGRFAANPLPISRELLLRGRQRFDVFCAPCHDRVGTGNGLIVRRGYTRPPTFHDERLRLIEDGHLFDVITRGYGQMPSYASQVPRDDRWAIVAYVRALQLSQDAELAALPAEVRRVAERALAGHPRPPRRAAEAPVVGGTAPGGPSTGGAVPGDAPASAPVPDALHPSDPAPPPAPAENGEAPRGSEDNAAEDAAEPGTEAPR